MSFKDLMYCMGHIDKSGKPTNQHPKPKNDFYFTKHGQQVVTPKNDKKK